MNIDFMSFLITIKSSGFFILCTGYTIWPQQSKRKTTGVL